MYEDLMSLYADELTQAETSRLMEEHLKSCPSCRAKYEAMKQPIPFQEMKSDPSIDHLRKIKSRQTRKLMLTALGIIGVVVVGILLQWFVLGAPTQAGKLNYQKIEDRLQIRGEFTGSAQVLTRYRVIDRGEYDEVIFYAGLPSILYSDGHIAIDIPFDKPVHVQGDIIQSDGFVIRRLAQALYEAKNSYIGDASKDLALLNTIGIQRIAPYTIALNTDKPPYELMIYPEITNTPDALTQELMTDYATLILSLIDNCELVSWHFGQSGKERVLINHEHATEVLGLSPKEYAKDAESMQKLLNKLGIYD